MKDLTTKKVLLQGRCENGLYPIRPSRSHALSSVRLSAEDWHARLGHPSTQVVQHVLASNKLASSSRALTHVCNACQQGKAHQLPFPRSWSVASFPLELIFSDVWGPAKTSSGGFQYYVSFIDDYSKFVWIYLLKRKCDVFDVIRDFLAHVERLLSRKILCVQSDWGGEYEKLSNTFFRQLGIAHHVSCPHTHQQNGSAERKHRHIVDMGLSLLSHASMPLRFWDEAYLSACYLINRLPSRVIGNMSPMEKLFSTKPDYVSLRTFGCACVTTGFPGINFPENGLCAHQPQDYC